MPVSSMFFNITDVIVSPVDLPGANFFIGTSTCSNMVPVLSHNVHLSCNDFRVSLIDGISVI